MHRCLGMAASDVFTAADIQIQKTIEYNLKELYPRATIIGRHSLKVVNDLPRFRGGGRTGHQLP